MAQPIAATGESARASTLCRTYLPQRDSLICSLRSALGVAITTISDAQLNARDVAVRAVVVLPLCKLTGEVAQAYAAQLHDEGGWSVVLVREALPSPHPPRAWDWGWELEVTGSRGEAVAAGIQQAEAQGADAVVVLGTDTQPSAPDIVRFHDELESSPQVSYVAGVRPLGAVGGLAALERAGYRLLLSVLGGVKLDDPRSGTWAARIATVSGFGQLSGSGYLREIRMLLRSAADKPTRSQIPLQQASAVPPDFHRLADGVGGYLAIMIQLMGFVLSSGMSMAIDLGLYAAAIHLYFHGSPAPRAVITSTIVARVISSLFNYTVNRNAVFRRKGGNRSFLRYYILAVGIMLASALGTSLMAKLMPTLLVLAKFLVDLLLFFVSYFTQKHWVFVTRTRRD